MDTFIESNNIKMVEVDGKKWYNYNDVKKIYPEMESTIEDLKINKDMIIKDEISYISGDILKKYYSKT